jgi:hypothetical protein
MPHAAIPSSNQPTIEFRQHHAVEAPAIDHRENRPGWRVKSRLDGLLAAKLITTTEYHRALSFRRLYETASKGVAASSVWNRSFVDPHCRAPAPEMGERQAAALARLAQIRTAIGALYVLLLLIVVEDAPWCAIGRHFGIDARTAQRWAVASIAALAVTTD